MSLTRAVVFILFLTCCCSFAEKRKKKLLLLVDNDAKQHGIESFQEGINKTFHLTYTSNQLEFCNTLSAQSYDAIVDISLKGWITAMKMALNYQMPYLRVDLAIYKQFLQVYSDFLSSNKIDENAPAVILFQNNEEVGMYFVGIRFENNEEIERVLKAMKPNPEHFAIMGSGSFIQETLKTLHSWRLFKRNISWNILVTDAVFKVDQFNLEHIDTIIHSCCTFKLAETELCKCPKYSFSSLEDTILFQAGQQVVNIFSESMKATNQTAVKCNKDEPYWDTSNIYDITRDKQGLAVVKSPPMYLSVSQLVKGQIKKVPSWNLDKQSFQSRDFASKGMKRPFYTIGMVLGKPWSWPNDASDLNLGFQGYSIELLSKLSEELEFDYEIVLANNNTYGSKMPDGSWSGIMGDLVSETIDISMAALVMTTDRKEAVDFVSPFFHLSGISIVMKLKNAEPSMTKILSVLRVEVWAALLLAVVCVAILLWVMEMYSPWSAKNNATESMVEQDQTFTFGESIWFSLTSLTPQGANISPRAVSGRVVTIAYWIFVALLASTFTSNLAAFLTVERMTGSVRNLNELGSQSKIKYSVVKDSPYMQYFNNMVSAEEEIYLKWNEIIQNSLSLDSEYQLWDYPVPQQYGEILKAIKETGFLESSEAGFQKVKDSLDGDFAFIHDSAEVGYEYYDNCDFTEIGNSFADQPLALAVPKGSPLRKKFGSAVLKLFKEGYFDHLTAKYWDSHKRLNCPLKDDSEGITLQTLGGIFIFILIGLSLSILTLVFELYFKSDDNDNSVKPFNKEKKKNGISLVAGM